MGAARRGGEGAGGSQMCDVKQQNQGITLTINNIIAFIGGAGAGLRYPGTAKIRNHRKISFQRVCGINMSAPCLGRG